MEASGEEIEKFTTKLERASERVFESASIWNTEPEAGAADPQIVAVLLLIRTLSNFRGTLILLRGDRIVEARTLTQYCLEDLFTIAALSEGGQRSYWKWAKTIKRAGKRAGKRAPSS